MKKKFWIFFLVTVGLLATVLGMYFKFIHQSSYVVFVESFDHGVITVDNGKTSGTDEKFSFRCKAGEEITVNINPERTDTTYYNLKALYVNGEDVTKDVDMLQYKTVVDSKLTILASFKKGKRPSASAGDKTALDIKAPELISPMGSGYIGSHANYDIKDPSIIYDEKSGYYYCFGSDNVVVKSTDLINWGGRTTYFPHDVNAQSNAIMSFSTFECVSDWAKEHGYGKDELYSDANEDRTPLAPDIVKVDGTYYLYFSLSKVADANESAIFCVKTKDLESAVLNKQWEEVGLVISSCGRHAGTEYNEDGKKKNVSAHYDEANAVHPNVIETENGLFMSYGSYYGRGKIQGGIYLLELNKKTGLLKKDSALNMQGEKITTLHGSTVYSTGKLIASPGRIPALSKKDGSLVTGSEIVYSKNEGYYYLLTTYGNEDTNYNIRVARSKNIEGPYTDMLGEDMGEFSAKFGKSMYDKGTLLMGGYNFLSSSKGGVVYSDIGRASIGSPSVIKTKNGDWFIASQSQLYFKAGTEITTGKTAAQANEIADVSSAPCLEIRQLLFTKDGWPMAEPEVYSGEKAQTKIKKTALYGNWDVIIFSKEGNSDDYKAVERSTSQIITIHEGAVITQKDIAKKKKLGTDGILTKADGYYTISIDGVSYSIYPTALWDWELSEGSVVFTGYGEDGSTIWGKKNVSASLGIYTDAFYYVLGLTDELTQSKYTKKIDKISSNPSQYDIDTMTDEMIESIIN
ncbi:MAG: glycoside hydrolase family 43 protein [Clostridia bacterium]|nr:glycoside hydrolase family 43 protein [Clostridia bacterium]